MFHRFSPGSKNHQVHAILNFSFPPSLLPSPLPLSIHPPGSPGHAVLHFSQRREPGMYLFNKRPGERLYRPDGQRYLPKMAHRPSVRLGGPDPWKARHSAARSPCFGVPGGPCDIRRIDVNPRHDRNDPLEAVLSLEGLSEGWRGEALPHHQPSGALAGACTFIGGEGGRSV